MAPDELEVFGAGLCPDDVVTVEATGDVAAIARILAPHARVVLAIPKATKAATRLRAKTDRSRRFRRLRLPLASNDGRSDALRGPRSRQARREG